MFTRRNFVALGAAGLTAACTNPTSPVSVARATVPTPPVLPPLPDFYGPIHDEPFPVPAVDEGVLKPELWRQEVANPWPDHKHGTIVVDPDAAILHFVQSREKAMRYGVAVGAAGFAWNGVARLQFTRKWPVWKVPAAMIERQPEYEPYSVANGGMPPGPDNPLGARALYLFQNGVDTLYRIHGQAAAMELGRAVSSGCIRMLDQDVIDLYDRSVHGATVLVLPSVKADRINTLY